MPLRLFLDWLLCVKWSIGGCRRPRCIIMSFFCHFYLRPNQCDKGPHTLHPCRASSPTSISPRSPITIWLLCFIIEQQSPKVNAPSFYLFFNPKTMDDTPPCTPLQLHLISIPSYITLDLFGLVVVCVIVDWQPSKATESFIYLFLYLSNHCPAQWDNVRPHDLDPTRLLSKIPSTADANS